MKNINIEKRAFTEQEAATYISVSRSFLRQDRMNNVRKNRTPGPKYIKKGRLIRYLKEHLDEWLEANITYETNTFIKEIPSNLDDSIEKNQIEKSAIDSLEAVEEKN